MSCVNLTYGCARNVLVVVQKPPDEKHNANVATIVPTNATRRTKFVADNNWCTEADVLEGQGKYGGKVYFDDKGAVTHIVYENVTYSPDSEVWELVKMKCRSTVLMVLTAMEVNGSRPHRW